MPDHYSIYPPFPAIRDMAALRNCADRILRGGVGIFPTAALYGLAADALNPDAVQRTFTLKQRPAKNPILVLVEEEASLTDLAVSVPETARILMEAFWPGRLTLVLQAHPRVPELLTAGTGKIGIRRPMHPVAAELCRLAGRPITGTSANLSGDPGAFRFDGIPERIRTAVDFSIDSGQLQGGKGSTVVDVTTTPVTIIREGAIRRKEIEAIASLTAPGGTRCCKRRDKGKQTGSTIS